MDVREIDCAGMNYYGLMAHLYDNQNASSSFMIIEHL
jgi:hypothetical protein